ncbi:multidrug resistance [Fusarium subglutinans]|uniref:Multidrug resistance n=1 Tax=Gibberella subglutinans TaxID=42677 RepID=A0A8H5NZC8_GIBSU|nr:multidrug resistance [Fusarium subglutinans]KAF5585111.1 multidrug resistance [Fusarium subglutinans]
MPAITPPALLNGDDPEEPAKKRKTIKAAMVGAPAAPALNRLNSLDSIFAASVLAANSILRSLFGAVFPLFTTYMYNDLGIHWASSISAFLAVACVPFPFLFHKYAKTIRMKCEYAAEAADVLQRMRTKHGMITEDQAELERRASNALRRSLTEPRTSKSIQ